MDQDAFRALLSTPNPSRPTQSSRPNGRLVLGGGSAGRSANSSQASGSTYKPGSSSTSLKPRKSKPKDSADGSVKDSDRSSRGGYRDRASERRKGLDGDFAEAEHLLENFQARVAAAGSQIDKDVLEQQTKYLGGDERHTILVKGLDHALLERRKAELSEGGKLGQVTDDDLEIAYEQNAKQAPPEDLAPSSTTSKAVKRKHRDELIEQLKNARTPADLVVVEKLKAAGKFKPIGFASVEDKKQDDERAERKRRKAEKKKKKALKPEQVVDTTPPNPMPDPVIEKAQQTSNQTVLETSTTAEKHVFDAREMVPPKITKSIEPSSNSNSIAILPKTQAQPKETMKKNEPIEDEDFDIFGDAGEYKGLDDDSSEDERDRDRKVEESVPRGAALGSSDAKKRKTYFEDDEVESDSNDAEKPNPVEECVRKAQEARRKSMAIEEPEEDPEMRDRLTGEAPPPDEAPPRPTKLEGLSGSADIRSILAADAFQEKEEKRKAKKQKNKSEGKVLTDKDRLNRDVLEMENYLKRKKTKNDPSATSSKS
ncbi:hypothetical protein PGT21_025521 [Puccinia graminis f. sp. tritici]|uniref:RED-like N-terminal domain-containing protein n=1 Tax=Puccinia graminis f. sp. tritici TaxID=56615 RepID=A0A5B0NTL4_PUCGR|nr:hypothetical protein PGT21_025521 [Puccinia graminis f. sp. tritici]KAA1092253.1 hypothetical protein PGTUg99_006984 [Puccinia graminis f. sp. tritici]